MRAAQPVLRAQYKADEEAGRRVIRKVVNVSSVSGVFGGVGQANYSSAKAGVLGEGGVELANELGALSGEIAREAERALLQPVLDLVPERGLLERAVDALLEPVLQPEHAPAQPVIAPERLDPLARGGDQDLLRQKRQHHKCGDGYG